MMNCEYLSFKETGVFSHNDTSYVELDPKLKDFYLYRPELAYFPEVIQAKQQQFINRDILVSTLKEQYQSLEFNQAVHHNIEQLNSKNTFTITTAHQPALFTGPLYYIYKIISTINLCKTLCKTYPQYHFVPVFVTGGEDHDFEEINHATIFNKKLVWENDAKGSVGKMSTQNIIPLLDELKNILGNSSHTNQIYDIIHKAHTKHKKYNFAALELVNLLFGEQGLVVLDMSSSHLKRLAIPFFQKEIIECPSENIVQKAQEKLVNLGFKSQAFARPINLFYLGDGFRERIEFRESKYHVLNQNISFSEEEILLELNQHPERFSPNVVMRPIYQEVILPNLAYIGGGGELAYWLERKEQFLFFNVPYPMLIRRDSVLWLDATSVKKMKQLEISIQTIWKDLDFLIKKIVKKISNEEQEISNELQNIKQEYQQIIKKLERIDKTLVSAAKGEFAKAVKGIENLDNKKIRAIKRNNETLINKVNSLKEKLFPNGNLQERKDNFIPYYTKYGNDFFEALYQYLDPLDRRVKIIVEENNKTS